MDPFFPEFLFGARCLWKNVQRDLISTLLLSREWTFSDEVLETRIPNWMDSFSSSTDPFLPPFFDFLLGGTCYHDCILFVTCNSDIREDASNYMTGLDSFYFGTGICAFLSKGPDLICWKVVARQSLPLYHVQERTVVLFFSDYCICSQVQDHGWNYMSLPWNIVHLPSTESFLPLSSQRKLSFLFDSWKLLLSTISFRALKFQVLIVWSIVPWLMPSIFGSLVAHCFE